MPIQPGPCCPPDRRRFGDLPSRTAAVPPLPGPANADLRSGPKRNFQIFSGIDFLAEATQPANGHSDRFATQVGVDTVPNQSIRGNLRLKPPFRSCDKTRCLGDQETSQGRQKNRLRFLTFAAFLPHNSARNGQFKPSSAIGIPVSYQPVTLT